MALPTPEIKKALPLFPISSEAINQALAEIEINPDVALIEEGELLRLHNPVLNHSLMTGFQVNVQGDRSFIEGALWSHRIIRTQAKLNGSAVPVLTEEVAQAHIDETIAKIRKTGKNLTMADYYLLEANEIEKRDPDFGRTTRDLTKYRGERWNMVGGMVDVYELLTRADTHSRLSSLNFRITP